MVPLNFPSKQGTQTSLPSCVLMRFVCTHAPGTPYASSALDKNGAAYFAQQTKWIHKRTSTLLSAHAFCVLMRRVGQNRIYTPYLTVYLVISLQKIPYTHRIYMVLSNPTYAFCVLVCVGGGGRCGCGCGCGCGCAFRVTTHLAPLFPSAHKNLRAWLQSRPLHGKPLEPRGHVILLHWQQQPIAPKLLCPGRPSCMCTLPMSVHRLGG